MSESRPDASKGPGSVIPVRVVADLGQDPIKDADQQCPVSRVARRVSSSEGLGPSLPDVLISSRLEVAHSVLSERPLLMKPFHKRDHCTFIAFWFEVLAILVPVCFHDGSNASPEEVRMKIHLTNRQIPMVCAAAAAAAAADTRALLA